MSPNATLLPALLASVAGDLRGLKCADLTPDGVASTWFAQWGQGCQTPPDEAVDVVVCEAEDLSTGARRCGEGGLILLRSPRAQAPHDRAELDALGLIQTSSVRDHVHVWTLLARVAPVPPLDGEPLASIVVVCTDQARQLWRVLAMLAVDEGPYPWELVVVDRSSFDETAALLRAVEGDLRIVNTERRLPFGDAIQRGFAAARGQWLVHLDLEFIPSAGFMAAAIDAALANPGVRCLTGPLLDGHTGRSLYPHGGGGTAPRARRELFAIHRQIWSSGPPWTGDELAVEAALARVGLAVVVPMFRARRPRTT